MTTLDSTAVPSKHPEAAFRVYDGEAVVVMPAGAEVHILNEVGARVWDLIDGHRSVAEIVGVIREEFDVNEAAAASDVGRFVNSLLDHAMVSA